MGLAVAGAVVGAVLVAGGRRFPRRGGRYFVLWCGSRVLVEVLERHGVRGVEFHRYRTTVKGRRYWRTKIVIRDRRLIGYLAWLGRNPSRLRRLMKRFEGLVLAVLRGVEWHGWRELLGLMPLKRLYRWFGIRPFDMMTYLVWRYRRLVRWIKPKWKTWRYVAARITWRDLDL